MSQLHLNKSILFVSQKTSFRYRFSFIALFLLIFASFSLFAQPSSWQTTGIGGGGALFSPSINPADANEIYIGCDMTPLFHTTNQGAAWTEKHYLQIQGGAYSEVQFTRDANIRYCVNHAAKDNIDRLRPFKTDDNGATWYPLIAPITSSTNTLRIFADYNSPSRILVADYSQIFLSKDGGATFTTVFQTSSTTIGNHIAGVCFDGANIYICCEDGIYQSTNNGTTWSWLTTTGLAAGEKILSFTAARTGSALKFVCLTANRVWAGIRPGSTYWGSMRGVFTMLNVSGNWTRQTTGINSAAGDFVVWLGMASNDTSTVYASGGDAYLKPIVMKSVNSQAWEHKFFHANNQNVTTGWSGERGDAHWDYGSAPQGFQVSPSNPNVVVTTDLGFAHITTDGGTTWRQMYVNPADQNTMGVNTPKKKSYHSVGLENTAAWDIAWLSEQKIMAGYTDMGGLTSTDGGSSWNITPILENSTYRVLKHKDSKIYAATSSIHDMYQSTRIYDAQIDAGKGKIYFSSDNGVSFNVLKDFGHPVTWIETDPTTPSVMYASVTHSDVSIGGIYKTSNLQNGASATWTKLPNPSRANGHAFNIRVLKNGDLVATFSARAPTTSSQFEASSGVFYYNKTTETWSDRSHTNMQFWTKDVTIDPADATQSTWYVAVFQGWGNVAMQGTGGLYRTRDKGLTWSKISNEFRVNSASVHPRNPDLVYYTTETNGLWYSTNATDATPTFNRVASYTFRHPMRVFFNPYNLREVWVTSFGNGMKIGYDPSIAFVKTPATPSVRGLYVDDFHNILGNTAKENAVLAYAQAKNFNYLALYELHYFDFNNATHRANLASFIRRAKTTYGITQVAATGEIASFFRDRILAQYQATRTDPLEKFDVLNLEFEFWSPVFTDAGGYYCTTYLQPNGLPCNRTGAFSFYMTQLTQLKQLCTTNNLICETEFGWFTAAEAAQFVPLSDRILVHAYVPTAWVNSDAATFYNYTKDRLSYIAAAASASSPKPTMVILSSEPEFCGPWLNATTPLRAPQAAFDLYKTSYDAETATWRENLSQVGYQWFTYTKMPENGTLPIDLLSFEARNTEGGNLLTWKTANEINNKGFDIERSENPSNHWTTLGFVSAKNKAATYDFTDPTPPAIAYYRLRQIDNDGKETVSKVVSVVMEIKKTLKAYPSVTSHFLTIESNANSDFHVLNLLGQVVLTGKMKRQIDVSALPQGTYFLKIGEEQVRFVRF